MNELMVALRLQTQYRKELLQVLRFRRSKIGSNAGDVIKKYEGLSDSELWNEIKWSNERILELVELISLRDLEDTLNSPLPMFEPPNYYHSNWSTLTPEAHLSWIDKISITSVIILLAVLILQIL